jgi:hypothetical protein
MTDSDEYAATFATALRFQDMGRARTAQTDGGVLGASDAGQCVHKSVLTVRQTPPSDSVKKGKAQIGTYLHAGTMEAVSVLHPHRLMEQALTVTLPSGIEIPLHPDEIDPSEPSVTDYKFTDDLKVYRKTGATDAQRMQRALQYLAAHQAGILPAEGIVRNLYVNMTDADDTHVDQEPFSMDWVHAADTYYQNVIYAVKEGEEGEKTGNFNFCRSYCPFVSICKPPIPELNQPIMNPELAALVLVGYDAVEQRKHYVGLEKQTKERLKGLSGRVGDVQIVTTTVNGKVPYEKISFRDLAS